MLVAIVAAACARAPQSAPTAAGIAVSTPRATSIAPASGAGSKAGDDTASGAPATAAAEGGPLRVWLPDAWLLARGGDPDLEGTALGDALADFQAAHPRAGVDVRLRRAAGPDGLAAFLASTRDVAPGHLPDLAALPLEAISAAAAAGLIQPFAALDPSSVMTGTFPFAAARVVQNKTVWALPGLVDVAHAVSRDPIAPIRWSAVGDGGPMVWPAGGAGLPDLAATLGLYAAAGGDVANPAAVDPTAAGAALTLLAEGAARGAVMAPAGGSSPRAAWNTFVSREIPAAAVSGGVFAPQQAAFPGLSWGPLPGPALAAPPVAWGWAFVLLARDAARARQAVALAEWLVDPARGRWIVEAGYLPAARRDWAARMGQTLDPRPAEAYLDFLEDQLNTARTAAAGGGWEAAWGAALADALSGAGAEAAVNRLPQGAP